MLQDTVIKKLHKLNVPEVPYQKNVLGCVDWNCTGSSPDESWEKQAWDHILIFLLDLRVVNIPIRAIC